jgi:cysteine desulfurase
MTDMKAASPPTPATNHPARRLWPSDPSLFKERKPHVISSVIEHAAVLETFKQLEKEKKIELTLVPVDTDGIVLVDEIKKALKPETILVSVMYVNNEIGTVQPIKDIAKLIRWYKKHTPQAQGPSTLSKRKGSGPTSIYPLVHVDAIQAANYFDINVERLGVDLMSLSGSKIYGPKSSGVLYVRNREMVSSMFHGGDQEFGLRAGTEDVAQVAGFAKALGFACALAQNEASRLEVLRDRLIEGLCSLPGVRLNGTARDRICNNVNVSVEGISGERLVIELDARGIAVSSKSACREDTDEESHVIAALRAGTNLPLIEGVARPKAGGGSTGSLRFTLGRQTNAWDIEKVIKECSSIIQKIRNFEKSLV